MSCKKLPRSCFFLSYVILVKSNIFYERKTDLDYRFHTTALSFPVESLVVCAMRCAGRVQCVTVFFNAMEILRQTEGKTILSFEGSDTGSWQYYGLYDLCSHYYCNRNKDIKIIDFHFKLL
jgi:hypothetical protein